MATENLKKVVLIITKSVANGEQVFKDGFQFTDVFAFIPELSAIPEVIKNKAALAAEVKNLTSSDLKELATFIETNLVLENKHTEEIVESVVEVIVAVLNVVAKIRVPAAADQP